MAERQWTCLSGVFWAEITYDEINEWQLFSGTMEATRDVMVARMELDAVKRDIPSTFPANERKHLLLPIERLANLESDLAAIARKWVANELVKLREDDGDAKTPYDVQQAEAIRLFNEWFPVGTVVEERFGPAEDWLTTIVDGVAHPDELSGAAVVLVRRYGDEVCVARIRSCQGPVEAGIYHEASHIRVHQWNHEHPIGSVVERKGKLDATSGPAFLPKGAARPVVNLEGIGTVLLHECRVLSHDEIMAQAVVEAEPTDKQEEKG